MTTFASKVRPTHSAGNDRGVLACQADALEAGSSKRGCPPSINAKIKIENSARPGSVA